MHLSKTGILFASALAVAYLALSPGLVRAQYNCGVAIELKGKAVLKGQIRDTQRPRTDQLWELLKTLSFSPTEAGKVVPDPKAEDRATLKGELQVKINGAGQVKLEELRLVRNKYDATAWVIAPEEVTLILNIRKGPKVEEPKK
jgi:hypothetical protein